MGIYDREYTKSRPDRDGGVAWGSRLPPRGALALIGLHALAFLLVFAARLDRSAPIGSVLVLRGSTSHPAAILLHPFGVGSIWSLIFVGYAIWTLGGRIESRFGTGRLLTLYVLGTILAGGVYFGFAQIAPDLARYPLALPVGAFAAWALAAWRNLSDEMVSIFGRLVTVSKATGIAALVVAGWVFFRGGPAATGWLLAAAAGSLAWPVTNLSRGRTFANRPFERSPTWRSREERRSEPEETDIDDILAKITREGLDALTPEERDRLEAARRAKQRRSR
jgi:membrane associated rhomboid family serine protease